MVKSILFLPIFLFFTLVSLSNGFSQITFSAIYQIGVADNCTQIEQILENCKDWSIVDFNQYGIGYQKVVLGENYKENEKWASARLIWQKYENGHKSLFVDILGDDLLGKCQFRKLLKQAKLNGGEVVSTPTKWYTKVKYKEMEITFIERAARCAVGRGNKRPPKAYKILLGH